MTKKFSRKYSPGSRLGLCRSFDRMAQPIVKPCIASRRAMPGDGSRGYVQSDAERLDGIRQLVQRCDVVRVFHG